MRQKNSRNQTRFVAFLGVGKKLNPRQNSLHTATNCLGSSSRSLEAFWRQETRVWYPWNQWKMMVLSCFISFSFFSMGRHQGRSPCGGRLPLSYATSSRRLLAIAHPKGRLKHKTPKKYPTMIQRHSSRISEDEVTQQNKPEARCRARASSTGFEGRARAQRCVWQRAVSAAALTGPDQEHNIR